MEIFERTYFMCDDKKVTELKGLRFPHEFSELKWKGELYRIQIDYCDILSENGVTRELYLIKKN